MISFMSRGAEGQTPMLLRIQARLRRNANARIFLAEAVGNMIFVFFADALMAQLILGMSMEQDLRRAMAYPPRYVYIPFGTWLNYALGAGLAMTVSMAVTEGVKVAHLNPAITVAAAMSDIFEWGYIPLYFLAQCLGGMLGGFLAYTVHSHNISLYDRD